MSEFFDAGRYRSEVIYIDNHLLGVVKPPNLPVQRDASGDPDLLSSAKEYIARRFDKPGKAYLGLVHRLDRPVGGAMVLARTSKAAARLSRAFCEHSVFKRYLAVVRGMPGGPLELEDYIHKDESTGMARVVAPQVPGAKLARLKSRPLAAREGLTLMEVALETGRSHQIRVQHASAGFPLWGDARYGNGRPGQQIALWAHYLCFDHPVTREKVSLLAPPPNTGIWSEFRPELEQLYAP